MSVLATVEQPVVVSSTRPAISRESLLEALRTRPARLTTAEIRVIIKHYPELVSEQRLQRLQHRLDRIQLERLLKTGAPLNMYQKRLLCSKFSQLLKDEPAKLLAYRYETGLVSVDEQRIRAALQRGIKTLEPVDLIRAMHERKALKLTVEMLTGITMQQKDLLKAESQRIADAGVFAEWELKAILEYKTPLQRQLEERCERGDKLTLTVKELTLLRNVRPELVSDKDIADAKVRELNKRATKRRNTADGNRAAAKSHMNGKRK